MPSDEIVEKARAEAEKNWPPLKLALWHVVTGAELNGSGYVNAYDLTDKLYAAALAAAEAGEQPVAWRFPAGPTFAERGLCWGYAARKEEAEKAAVWGGVHPLYASPPSEASRDERAAKALDLIAKMAGNVVFNGKQSPISHEDHMRAWAEIASMAGANATP